MPPSSTYPIDQHHYHLPQNVHFDSADPGQALLERYTVEILEALNAGDFTAPALDRLSPDLKTDREIIEGQMYQGRNAAEFLSKHSDWLKCVPTRTFRIVDYSSAFDSSMGRADVWLLETYLNNPFQNEEPEKSSTMRLINVATLAFENFFDERTPPYAVVSHRWAQKEISYQDYLAGRYQNSPGYDKIIRCCSIAKARNLTYLWIDTCCIDKTSSAELTEAINSMYTWYQKAVECYAIITDLPHNSSSRVSMFAAFEKSAWFTRGWTLQELLAPQTVLFYDSTFTIFASKTELAPYLQKITGIRSQFLSNPSTISQASIAEKMSWASTRTTTRVEDTAYSLLGIFGVNMPLLYGEREKAFFRLQLEILRNSDDESIYAWTSSIGKDTCGMLATWPSDFALSGNIRRFAVKPEDRVPWTWTGKGLEVRLVERNALQTSYDPVPVGQHSKLVTLGCAIANEDSSMQGRGKIVAITLERKGAAWQRIDCDRLTTVYGFDTVSRLASTPLLMRHYYVPQTAPEQAGNY